MKIIWFSFVLFAFSSCFDSEVEKSEAKSDNAKIESKKTQATSRHEFIVGDEVLVSIYLEVSRRNDIKSKYNNFDSDEGPCGEVYMKAEVKSFGPQSIELAGDKEGEVISDISSVSDAVYTFDKNKKKIKTIYIPYGNRVIGIVKGGEGVIVDVDSNYYLFSNGKPLKVTIKGSLKEMEYVDRSHFKDYFAESDYRQAYKDLATGYFVVMNGPCT